MRTTSRFLTFVLIHRGWRYSIVGLLLVAGILSRAAIASPPINNPAGIAFFEKSVRPVLIQHCYSCHSFASGKSEGGLRLDSRKGVQAGGDSGPAVVPGDPSKSLLLTAIRHSDPNLHMPPKKAPLSAAIVADFETWIRMGAPDPRENDDSSTERPPTTIEAGRRFWSYRKPTAIPLPAAEPTNWARRDLDRFILAKLNENSLAPSPDAAPETLLRRLSFDLIGLPPTPDELAAYGAGWRSGNDEERESLLATTTDRMLASPRFGERWGRHWLDVARFAESNGRESNLTFTHAWRYRDYVIDAFNAGIPFDRFITEQIAGDLLPAKDDADRARLLIATGFLALGAKGLTEMDRAQFDADMLDEQIDTLTRAVIGCSVACARCHDHKSDPFSMTDYYALAGIFMSTKSCFGASINSESNIASDLVRLPDLPGQLIPNKPLTPQQVTEMKAQVEKLNAEEKAGRAAIEKALREVKNPNDFFTLGDFLRIYWSRGGLEGQLKQVDDQGRALPLCMGVSDAASVVNAPLLERGEIAHPGAAIPRGFPRVFEVSTETPPSDSSGRLQLARWLTHPDHPLTARVISNRVWRHLFGIGIVRTVDDFGFTGERPSHPELLDHLALKLTAGNWQLKPLIREIVLSRTYRQSSMYRADGDRKDPENRWLWRSSKRRLEAEAIRDAMLSASGSLDLSRRPGSLIAEIGDTSVSLFGFNKAIPADLDGTRRRSVYLPVVRDRLPDLFELFDGADPSFVTGSRDVTNVPPQALYLLNSSFVQEQSVALAQRLTAEPTSDAERIQHLYLLCFGRFPDDSEAGLCSRWLQFSELPRDKAWTALCQSLFATSEFRIVD